jgi:hypothetical protein
MANVTFACFAQRQFKFFHPPPNTQSTDLFFIGTAIHPVFAPTVESISQIVPGIVERDVMIQFNSR